ncbi:unnamed protein product [Microthlaspi erraticum]|uniref:Uncharacterized protein n=1 Tax=Microthlaspi erraticum TaxID=1685480 RepID=A0A6D2HL63_9BRAS|nr:unnamed protein product [Microthlaspi erraticum]
MAACIALFSGLCGFRKKTQSHETIQTENQSSSPLETKEREQISDDLHNKERDDQDSNASHDDDHTEANPELPLPPARKAALQETYSCNNMVLQKSRSTKKKLSASLTIQVSRTLSIAKKRDAEEEKSVRKKKLKAEKSMLVRPIILGDKCRVLDGEEEADEDHSPRLMPKNRIYRPRSMSSVSISRTNSKIDINVIPVKEKTEDSVLEKEEK